MSQSNNKINSFLVRTKNWIGVSLGVIKNLRTISSREIFKKIQNAPSYYHLAVIVALGIFLRVVKITTAFYGATGEWFRDLIVVHNFLMLGQWPLLGPSSSLGGFYFGAVYYYILAPFVWLFSYASYGAMGAGVFFSVLSIVLLYNLLMEWFKRKDAALLGSLLLSISVVDVQNVYYISNPNLLPFFSLWFFYCLTKILKNDFGWLVIFGLGVSLGIATQLHATALLILPPIMLIGLTVRGRWMGWGKAGAVGLLVLLCYSPYILYEFFNNFQIIRGLIHLGSGRFSLALNYAALGPMLNFFNSVFVVSNDFFDFYSLHLTLSVVLIFLCVVVPVVWFLVTKNKNKADVVKNNMAPSAEGFLLMSLWLGGGIMMFLLFAIQPQFFYFLCLWPLPIIGFTWLLLRIKNNNVLLYRYMLAVLVIAQAIQLYYFFYDVNRRTYSHSTLVKVFKAIKVETIEDGGSFNVLNEFSSIAEHRYYLKISGLENTISRVGADHLYFVIDHSQVNNNPLSVDFEKYFFSNQEQFGGLEVAKYSKIFR